MLSWAAARAPHPHRILINASGKQNQARRRPLPNISSLNSSRALSSLTSRYVYFTTATYLTLSSYSQIADTHFRRQFLFQLLILLNHLLLFTKTSRAIWTTTRNRSLQFEFTLEPPETQWVTETINKAQEELRQTAPGGRAFADSVSTILEREKNRVKWKNDLCTPFDKEPYSVEVEGKRVGLWEETGEARKKMKIEPKQWEYRQGTAALTEIWDMGLRDIRDLENPFQ